MKKDFNVFTNFNPPYLGECLFRPVGRAGNETDNEISNLCGVSSPPLCGAKIISLYV